MEPLVVLPTVGVAEVQHLAVVSEEGLEQFESQLAEMSAKLDSIQQEISLLFRIEEDQRQILEYNFRELSKQRNVLEKKTKIHRSGYTYWIPLDPLFWRNEQTKMPSVMLFSFDNPVVSFKMRWENKDRIVRHRPAKLEGPLPGPLYSLKVYDDITTVMSEPPYRPDDRYLSWESDLILQAKFSGVIPSGTRQKIHAVLEEKTFDSVYLLCEVKEWHKTARPVHSDPLVIGWSDVYPNRFWYIDAFDISPLENRIPITR